MFDTSYDSVGAELPYMFVRSRIIKECVASEGVRTLKYDTDKATSQSMYNRYSDFEELRPTGEASHIPDTRLGDE